MENHKREIFGRNELAEAMEIKRERRLWKEKIQSEATDLYKQACRENDEKKAAWYMAEIINIAMYDSELKYY